MRRIDKVKSWLSNSCAYRDVYEHRSRQRHENSCHWFLNTTEYCKWKNSAFDDRQANNIDSLDANWHERVLFAQGEFVSSQGHDSITRSESVRYAVLFLLRCFYSSRSCICRLSGHSRGRNLHIRPVLHHFPTTGTRNKLISNSCTRLWQNLHIHQGHRGSGVGGRGFEYQ